MRVAGTILSLSLLVSAVPAFAQGGSYQEGGNWYSRQSMNRDGYGYLSPEQQHLQSRPTYPGDWQQQSYGQNQQGPWQQGQMQPGPMQQMMQQGQMGLGMQGGYAPYQMGQTGQRPSTPVSSATQGQIKSSLEIKRVQKRQRSAAVLPDLGDSADGSKVVMQVSSDGVYGVVVNETDQTSSSGTGGAAGTSSSTGSASASTGGTSGAGSTSGGTGSASTGSAGSGPGSVSTGDTSSAGGTSSGTGSASTWAKARHQQYQQRRHRRNRRHHRQHRRDEQHRHGHRQEQRQGADDNPLEQDRVRWDDLTRKFCSCLNM